MARVSLLKQIKIDGKWVRRPVPKKPSGAYDFGALPDGRYFVEWYESGDRRREVAGNTATQALEAQRRKKHELEGRDLGLMLMPAPPKAKDERPLLPLIDRYLEHVETLKKINTHRKYESVLHRFSAAFKGRTFESVSIEEMNDFVVKLMRGGMSANTVLHNAIIIAQFFRRHGRPGLTRELELPEYISTLPREYSEEDLTAFFAACNRFEETLFSTFLLTGMREQEVMFLFWPDINFKLHTIRVTAKPDYGFYPKRWEEREIPVPGHVSDLLDALPRNVRSPFVFPSPTGNREQRMLYNCKDVALRAGLKTEFDLKTFRSTYATRMLRAGFDVRTVQHWMGHKSLETTMRYLVPATDVHQKLDQVLVPGRSLLRKPQQPERLTAPSVRKRTGKAS